MARCWPLPPTSSLSAPRSYAIASPSSKASRRPLLRSGSGVDGGEDDGVTLRSVPFSFPSTAHLAKLEKAFANKIPGEYRMTAQEVLNYLLAQPFRPFR